MTDFKPIRKTYVAQMFGDGVKQKDLTREQKSQYITARRNAISRRPHGRTGETEDKDTTFQRDEILEEEQTLVQELFGYDAKLKNLTPEQKREYNRVLGSRRSKIRIGTGQPSGKLTGEPTTLCERLFGKGMRVKDLNLKQRRQYDLLCKARQKAKNTDDEEIVLQPGQIGYH